MSFTWSGSFHATYILDRLPVHEMGSAARKQRRCCKWLPRNSTNQYPYLIEISIAVYVGVGRTLGWRGGGEPGVGEDVDETDEKILWDGSCLAIVIRDWDF